MNKLRVFMQFVLISLLVTATSGPARVSDPETGTLQGKVTDEVGAVLAEASVLIQRWKFERYGAHPVPIFEPVVWTDSEGRYSVELPAGTYNVFIVFPGMTPFAKMIKIVAGKETKLNRKLRLDRLAELVE